MGPDGVEVDSDGGELLDWLWDFPERYDVGIADEPMAAAGAAEAGLTGVRKHLRRPGEAADLVMPAPPAMLVDERPTVAIDSYQSYDDEDEGYAYPPTLAVEPRARRNAGRDLAAAAAVVLVVAAGVGIGYTLFSGKGARSGKSNNLAIGSPSTTSALQAVIPPLDTTSSTADTTTSVPPTSVPTSSSVPAVIPAATTTTRHPTTTLPHPTTTTATTTTTVPPTTTTTTTTTTAASTTTTAASTTTSMPMTSST